MSGYGRYGDSGSIMPSNRDAPVGRSFGYFGYGGRPREPEHDPVTESVHETYTGHMARARESQRRREEAPQFSLRENCV